MFAFLNLGMQELLILVVIGVMMVASPLFVLWLFLRGKGGDRSDND